MPSKPIATAAASTLGGTPTLGVFTAGSAGSVSYAPSLSSDLAPAFSIWFPLGGNVREHLAACNNILGSFTVFGIDRSTNSLSCLYQGADGIWPTTWTPLSIDSCVGTPIVVQDDDGLIFVFAITMDKTTKQYGVACARESTSNNWQYGGAVTPWPTPAPTKIAHLAANFVDGDIILCATDGEDFLYTTVGTGFSSGFPTWQPTWSVMENPKLVATISPPCMAILPSPDTGDAVTNIFAVRAGVPNILGQPTVDLQQTYPSSDSNWAAWATIADLTTLPVIQATPLLMRNTSGVAEGVVLFLRDSQNTLYYLYQLATGTGWSSVTTFPSSPFGLFGPTYESGPFLSQNPNGFPDAGSADTTGNGLVIFVIGSDSNIYFTYQTEAGVQASWDQKWTALALPTGA